MFTCLAFVLNTFVYFPAMAPFQHFVHVLAAALVGPWYGSAAGALCGVLRMLCGRDIGSVTGAMFGPILGGLLYRKFGTWWSVWIGEIIGTGIIGAIVSYPVMTLLWGKEGLSWLFYVPSFICGTLIGGSIAYVFLRKIASNGMLARLQNKLGSQSYTDKSTVLSDALTIAAFGAILFVVIQLASGIFGLTGSV